MHQPISSGQRWKSPNGAEWRVVNNNGDVVTLQLEKTDVGVNVTSVNKQKFSVWELNNANGWRRI